MLVLQAVLLSAAFTSLAVPPPICYQPAALEEFVSANYGSRIEFDVVRKGKTIGRHTTTFAGTPAGLTVNSHMQIEIKVLLIPVYRFSYQSQSIWCGDRMTTLDATVSDNGDTARTRAQLQDGALLVGHEGDERLASPRLIPTDHWNPHVLERSEVLNTITGRVNQVTIGACTEDSELISSAAPNARCYEYRGDLKTRVWYDKDRRWVGLAFADATGSEILYVCRSCTRAPL